MKCQHCGKEIAEHALFCKYCGKKQEIKEEDSKMQSSDVCAKCGAQLKDGAKFCVACGTKVQVLQSKEEALQPKAEVQKPKEEVPQSRTEAEATPKKGNIRVLILIVILVIVLLALIGFGAWMIIGVMGNNSPSKEIASVENNEDEEVVDDKTGKEDKAESIEGDSDESLSEEVATEETNKEVDIDMKDNAKVTLVGTLKNSSNGIIVKFAAPICVREDNDNIIDDVKLANIDGSELPAGMLEWLTLGEDVTIKGEVYIEDESLYIIAETMTNAVGEDMVEAYEKDGELSDEYILPTSDTVRLTESDIQDLTLRELNYAKNEIYARHGRKFDSQELRDYFTSKSWYKGTINPEDFSDDMLSKVERDNVKLLKEAEFAINSKGYQLDQ